MATSVLTPEAPASPVPPPDPTVAPGWSDRLFTAAIVVIPVAAVAWAAQHFWHHGIGWFDLGLARYVLHELLGKVYKPFGDQKWWPGTLIATTLVVLGWGYLIYTGNISTIWPLFVFRATTDGSLSTIPRPRT